MNQLSRFVLAHRRAVMIFWLLVTIGRTTFALISPKTVKGPDLQPQEIDAAKAEAARTSVAGAPIRLTGTDVGSLSGSLGADLGKFLPSDATAALFASGELPNALAP